MAVPPPDRPPLPASLPRSGLLKLLVVMLSTGLAARLRPEMRGVWVNNAGLDGHSTFGHLLLTRQALVPLHPKAILYLVGLNDMFTDAPRDFDRVAQNPL